MRVIISPNFSLNMLPKLEGFLATALVEMVEDPLLEEVAAHRDLVRDVKDVPV
jgi:hypothetical protein